MSIFKSDIFKFNVLAILVFVIATFALCYPVLQGKRLNQSDIRQFRGGAEEIIDYRENKGRQIFWTNSMFSGMPADLISIKHDSEFLRFIPNTIRRTFPDKTEYILILMLSFYLLMRSLKQRWGVAVLGALLYGMSSFYIIYLAAGHDSKVHTLGYLPGILAGLIWLFRHKSIFLGLAVFTIFLAWGIEAGHPQMLYYFLFVVLAYIVYEFITYLRNKELIQFLKFSVFSLIGLVLAVLSSYTYLKTTMDFGENSIRGKSELSSAKTDAKEGLDVGYVTNWSYGVGETMSLFIPNFKGGESKQIGNDPKILKDVPRNFKNSIAGQNHYWGDQPFTSGPAYAGAVVVFLFVLGLFLIRDKMKYPIIIALILTTMLAWGENFLWLTELFLENVPYYNKFRAVSSIMVIAQFCIPLIAMYCLNIITKIEDWNEKISLPILRKSFELKKIVWSVFLGLFGIGLVAYLIPETINTFLSKNENDTLLGTLQNAGLNGNQSNEYISSLISARINIFKADVIRTLIFLALGGALLWLFIRKQLKANVFIILIGLVMVIDGFTLNRRYLNEANYTSKVSIKNNFGIEEKQVDRLINTDKDPHFRVLNLTVSPFNDATTSFYHKSIGGYHGAKLKIYQELVENQISNDLSKVQKGFNGGLPPDKVFSNTNALNMLNTKYLIANPNTPILNSKALGNAWFVNTINFVETADDEIAQIDDIEVSEEALIRASYKKDFEEYSPKKDSLANIRLISYDPEKLVYSSTNKFDGFAVFSEVYYPKNWKALVDGEEVNIIRTNYVLRGVKIPKGEHTIELIYRNEEYQNAASITKVSSSVTLLAVAFLLFLSFGRQRKEKVVGESETKLD